jgi:ketosteroid isomerase-like protein
MGEGRVEMEVSSRRVAVVGACCYCFDWGELNGTGRPGATGSGVKCYMVRCWEDGGWACARWSRGIFGIFPA